ncbi:MAG: type II secretion system F family protein [Desulfitobacteriaceae bacterium]
MKKRSYRWRAVDDAGMVHRGVWEIKDIASVRSLLFKQGYYPVSIRLSHPLWSRIGYRDSRRVWSSLIRRLSTLLETGIPLLTALEIIVQQENRSKTKQLWLDLKEIVAAGNDLSDAILATDLPPPVYAQAMIKAGERSGNLAQALGELAEEIEQEQYFTLKLQRALTYPLSLAWATLGVLYVLGNWVLPMYQRLFDSLGAELPYFTRFIFTFGHWLPISIWILGVIVTGVVVSLRFLYPNSWQEELRQWKTRIPGLGKVFRLRELFHFSRILAMLLNTGVVLNDALKLAENIAESREMVRLIKNLQEGVNQGRRLTPIFRASAIFPTVAQEMLGVAEESGQWDKMFQHVAKMLKMEFDELLEGLVRLVEPVLIIGLAGLIGVIAVGVFLPIFDMGTHLQ